MHFTCFMANKVIWIWIWINILRVDSVGSNFAWGTWSEDPLVIFGKQRYPPKSNFSDVVIFNGVFEGEVSGSNVFITRAAAGGRDVRRYVLWWRGRRGRDVGAPNSPPEWKLLPQLETLCPGITTTNYYAVINSRFRFIGIPIDLNLETYYRPIIGPIIGPI